MQLIAVKRISDQRPEGAIFEESWSRAHVLIAVGVAKPYEGEVTPPATLVVAPVAPVSTPAPVASRPMPASKPSPAPPVRRGRPVGAQTFTRSPSRDDGA